MLDFLGIGAQKCGTTWLFAQLAAHPGIAFPVGKEVHFWDRRGGRPGSEWLRHFPDAPGVRQGEITPAYSMLDRPTIEAVYEVVPDVRLFLSIRNPMARAWSAAKMMLERAEMTLEEASDQWFLDHFHSRGSRHRGDYADCLDRWLSVYPEASLSVILFDDICAEPRKVLMDLARHVGVDPGFFADADEEVLVMPVFEGPGGALRPSLLEPLRELYGPGIDSLAERTGRDLTPWLAWDGGQ